MTLEEAIEILAGCQTCEGSEQIRQVALFMQQQEEVIKEMHEAELNNLVKEVHENAINKGWWEEERAFGELIALCHSELSEALEEYRNGHNVNKKYWSIKDYGVKVDCLLPEEGAKPEGIPIELADVVIRIMDMCGHYGIDLQEAIEEKMEYNKTRPHKHGGKVI